MKKSAFVVSHIDEKSKLIVRIQDAVFTRLEDAEEFVKLTTPPRTSAYGFLERKYDINEVAFVDESNWSYWKKQITTPEEE